MPRRIRFDGHTFDDGRDGERLLSQHRRIFDLMLDERWRTPPELEAATGDPWASISARLRDMRKRRYGAHTVNRRYVQDGLWEYQLVPQPPEQIKLV